MRQRILCYSCRYCKALVPVREGRFVFSETGFKCVAGVVKGVSDEMGVTVCEVYVEDKEDNFSESYIVAK